MKVKPIDQYTDYELIMLGKAAVSIPNIHADLVAKINDEQLQCMKSWERAKHDVEWMERVKAEHQKNIQHFIKRMKK